MCVCVCVKVIYPEKTKVSEHGSEKSYDAAINFLSLCVTIYLMMPWNCVEPLKGFDSNNMDRQIETEVI